MRTSRLIVAVAVAVYVAVPHGETTDAVGAAERIDAFVRAEMERQRIPGVSINRVNGDGAQVTVRGFGPGYNLVTLNGRTLDRLIRISSSSATRSNSFSMCCTRRRKSYRPPPARRIPPR